MRLRMHWLPSYGLGLANGNSNLCFLDHADENPSFTRQWATLFGCLWLSNSETRGHRFVATALSFSLPAFFVRRRPRWGLALEFPAHTAASAKRERSYP